MGKTIEFEGVKNFRKLEDPHGRKEKDKYVFYAAVKNIPTNIPMGTNPRDQKLSTNIAKGIQESLVSNDENFHLKNRGMVISASNVSFNNKTNRLTMVFENENEHGNIDGGHTYKIIMESIHEKKLNIDQYVYIEVMVDVEDMIEDLAEARNKSVEVDDKSLAELQNKFDPIKDAIGGMPFYDRIAFKQNQQLAPGVKMIDAREIVAILSMFDIKKYSFKNHPKQAYSSKKMMLDRYLEDPSHFERFSNIATDIFDLYDQIEREFPTIYIENGGKYGAIKFSGYNEGKKVKEAKFSGVDMIYTVPVGLIYPLLAAFRGVVEYNDKTDKYEWKYDIMPFYDSLKADLVDKVMSFTRSLGSNPNAAGKDNNLWDVLLMTVLLNTN